ncbi:hypothetical protein Tco_0911542 [Tanacetum coccineum]|uniref:Uncharacterized protein n=1 Tax=Tanacetum coccineum TaxID=301880 RepID=A0ABQ5CXQ0_9ASTR
MSDSEDSTVTYTEVSSPFTDLSNIGSPRVDGPPVMPRTHMPTWWLLFRHHHLLTMCLAQRSQSYVPESNPEEDPEEDNDEDPEEDPADYPADRGDDGDDEDESFDDDEDDDVDIKEEEEEHLAPADSTAVALPAVDHAPSAKDTELFETDESAATPPPHLVYQIPSPPLPSILSPLLVSSPPLASPTYPLGYRAAMIRLRAEAPSTSHSPPLHIILSHTRADTPPSGTPPLLPIPAPKSSPSLLLPSADHGADMPEIMRDLERDVGYGITDTWEEMLVDMLGTPATDDTELGRRMIEFATRVRQDTNEIYVSLDHEQTKRQLMAGRINMLYKDRRAHARTTLLMEREARMS